MDESLNELVEKLKDFKKKLDLENTEEFDNLISLIINKLPDNYSSKIKTLSFYEVVDDEGYSDLPF